MKKVAFFMSVNKRFTFTLRAATSQPLKMFDDPFNM